MPPAKYASPINIRWKNARTGCEPGAPPCHNDRTAAIASGTGFGGTPGFESNGGSSGHEDRLTGDPACIV